MLGFSLLFHDLQTFIYNFSLYEFRSLLNTYTTGKNFLFLPFQILNQLKRKMPFGLAVFRPYRHVACGSYMAAGKAFR